MRSTLNTSIDNVYLTNDPADNCTFRSIIDVMNSMNVYGTIYNTELNTNTTNITNLTNSFNTLQQQVNNMQAQLNALNNGITVMANAYGGYNINIGNVVSNVYINGNLYYNGGLIYRQQNQYNNAVAFEEYINQMI